MPRERAPALEENATATRKAIEEVQRQAVLAREAAALAADDAEDEAIAAVERLALAHA